MSSHHVPGGFPHPTPRLFGGTSSGVQRYRVHLVSGSDGGGLVLWYPFLCLPQSLSWASSCLLVPSAPSSHSHPLNRPADTSPLATALGSFSVLSSDRIPLRTQAGPSSLPGLSWTTEQSCLPCPWTLSGVHVPRGLRCKARLPWVHVVGWACSPLCLTACPQPAGTSRSCTGTWSTWPRSRTPTRTCSPCSLP